jgi:hypothetical protein
MLHIGMTSLLLKNVNDEQKLAPTNELLMMSIILFALVLKYLSLMQPNDFHGAFGFR